ncbi:hypothetical protein ACMFMF_004356 [Clarireedia jacksonii]
MDGRTDGRELHVEGSTVIIVWKWAKREIEEGGEREREREEGRERKRERAELDSTSTSTSTWPSTRDRHKRRIQSPTLPSSVICLSDPFFLTTHRFPSPSYRQRRGKRGQFQNSHAHAHAQSQF